MCIFQTACMCIKWLQTFRNEQHFIMQLEESKQPELRSKFPEKALLSFMSCVDVAFAQATIITYCQCLSYALCHVLPLPCVAFHM